MLISDQTLENGSNAHSLDSTLKLARKFHEENQVEKAIENYNLALKIEPNCIVALNQLAGIYRARNELERVINCYQKVAKIQPNQSLPLARLGQSLGLQGNLEQALEAYKKAIIIHQELPVWVYSRLADILEHNESDLLLVNFARSLGSQGNLEQAIEIYQQAITTDQKLPLWSYCGLADALQQHGQLSEAILVYEKSIALNYENPYVYRDLAQLYFEEHRLDDAINSYQRVVQLNLDLPFDIYKNVADALESQGRKEEVTTWLKSSQAWQTYSKIWQRLNHTTLENFDQETAYNTEESTQNQVKYYFDKTTQYRVINLKNLSQKDQELIESVGLSIDNLRLNLERMITKDGVSEIKLSNPQKFKDRQQLMLEDGCIYAICPNTGRTLRSNCSLFYFYRFCFYRFVGSEVFYLISESIIDYLYFPRADIIISLDKPNLPDLDFIKNNINIFKSYLLNKSSKIVPYILKTEKEKVAAVLGLAPQSTAHSLWDDLSGLQILCDTNNLENIDQFIVAPGSEHYGGVDEIFPEINTGKVKRLNQLDCREEIISHNYFALRLSERFVRENLAKRIYQASLRKCSSTFLAELEVAKNKHFPLLWVGFRLGKRTWVSQIEGIANIINRLSEKFPDLGIVFDGISRVDINGTLVVKPNEEQAIRKEKDTVSQIQSLLSKEIQVYDIIGCPMYEVLVWANASDLYMAPFGGGLAKIVSIANKPGVIHTNRFGVEDNNFSVYSRMRENSALSVLIPEHYIVDAPEDELSINRPINRSYDCDWRGIYEEVYKLASSLKRD